MFPFQVMNLSKQLEPFILFWFESLVVQHICLSWKSSSLSIIMIYSLVKVLKRKIGSKFEDGIQIFDQMELEFEIKQYKINRSSPQMTHI